MKKTSLVLALAVSISGISPLLANEVEQQTNENVEGIVQQDQGNKTQQETTQTPSYTNVDWSLPGMQLSDWEYEELGNTGESILKKYVGRPTDIVYVPSVFMSGEQFIISAGFSGVALEGSAIKNLKIVGIHGTGYNDKVDFYDTAPMGDLNFEGVLNIPDNSVIKSIEFASGSVDNILLNGSEVRAQNNDFVDIKGYDAHSIGLFGNINIANNHIPYVKTDLKYAEYIDCNSIAIVEMGTKRVNSNPLYLQTEVVNYYTDSSMKESYRITNHYQLNQLLDGMGIKSEMQLKLDANGGNGGVVIQQPVFFVDSLTEEQQKQFYQNEQDLDACIRIAFLENPTYYPTLEGRTFLGWEKQPTNTRAVADAFNQTYLAKWSDPVPVPTVTPTQPQQPVVESKPTASVNTANRTTAVTLATVALAGCIGLITLRRFK